MGSSKLPQNRRRQDLSTFLQQAERLPQRFSSDSQQRGRLIFALDATASRQPSWDRACQLQNQMFQTAESLGGLQLQLCYYRGFNEFYASEWVDNTRRLQQIMGSVLCLGGYTQLERVLEHCLLTHRQHPVQAAIIIGDAVEESVDTLCNQAGKLGLMGLPLFVFQEGSNASVRQCFQQLGALSNGAFAAFDDASAERLAELLRAVASFASGGYPALERLQSSEARQLLQQLKK